jgi:hypothetical protein
MRKVDKLFPNWVKYGKGHSAINRHRRKTNLYMPGLSIILIILVLLQSCCSGSSEIKFSELNKEAFIKQSLDCQLKYFTNKNC